MNRANVLSALGTTSNGSVCNTATTVAAGAGAGLCTRFTVTWAAAHNEQSAWVAAPSAWVCATWTVPATTTSRTHISARRTLQGLAVRVIWRFRPI